MTQEEETVEIWKDGAQKEIDELEAQNMEMKGDIRLLQDKALLQEQAIQNIQGDL